MKYFLISLIVIFENNTLQSQNAVNGFLQGEGKGNIVVSYFNEKYNSFYTDTSKVDGIPIFNKVNSGVVSLFSTYGLTKKLDIQFNLSHVKKTGNASNADLNLLGLNNTVKGLQDVSFFIKHLTLNRKYKKGNFDLLTSFGVQFPFGSYKIFDNIQSSLSLGNGATQLSAIAVAQYKWNKGFFANGSIQYNAKNFDILDAISGEIKLGYAHQVFYVDAFITKQYSSKSIDLIKGNFNSVYHNLIINYTKVGFSAYIPMQKQIGFAAGFNTYLNGRNIANATGGYGALIYSF